MKKNRENVKNFVDLISTVLGGSLGYYAGGPLEAALFAALAFGAVEVPYRMFFDLKNKNSSFIHWLNIKNLREKKLKHDIEKGIANWKDLLYNILWAEIPKQLQSINYNSKREINFTIKNLISNSSFTDRIPSSAKQKFLYDISESPIFSLSISDNLGIAHNELKIDNLLRNDKKTITVAFPVIALGVSAIFFYLKKIKGYNLNLRYDFAHALELAIQIKKGNISPDACVVGDAPSIQLIGKEKRPFYHFFMFLPKGEQRIVGPKHFGHIYKDDALKEGDYFFISDQISTMLFQFEYLKKRGSIDKNRVNIHCVEPHEFLSILQKGDINNRLITWAPHWQIYKHLKLGKILDKKLYSGYWYDQMLFLKNTFYRYNNKRVQALAVAINNAWIELHKPDILHSTIQKILNDKYYSEYLRRYCGIYDFHDISTVVL